MLSEKDVPSAVV